MSSETLRDSLPRLLLIADGFASGRQGQSATAVQERVVALVEAGVAAVQLRDHAVSPETFAKAVETLAERLRAVRPEITLFVNTHADVARALGTGAHVGRREPSVAAARRQLGAEALLGYSAHTEEEARQATEAGADLVLFSPIFPTTSHPEAEPVGLDALRRTCAALPGVPVFALGGITPDRVTPCLKAGAHGVAVLSALLGARDPVAVVHAFHAALTP